MKSKGYNCFRVIFAHVLLVILSLMCLFFFYILLVNATRSHADLQRGFSALPGGHLLTNHQQSDCLGQFCGNLHLFFSADCVWTLCIRLQIKESRVYVHYGNLGDADAGYSNGLSSTDYRHGHE